LDDTDGTLDRDALLVALRELVEALDKRVPHVERLGEVRIAREAAALREEAARRIQELAVMTDDGGPLPGN
jgi:hypothetical protein